MPKIEWKPGNMLNPAPVVLVTTRSGDGEDDVATIAWTGTICSDPVMLSISVRKSRLTYANIMDTGVFTVNLATEEMGRATDLCGVISGRDEDKFLKAGLMREEASHISCPMLEASPVNLECRVTESKDLGSHTIFLASVEAVHVDGKYVDEKQRFHFNDCHPIVYSHGEYRGIGKYIGKFGYSVQKIQKKSVKKHK
jgi:flavin reductase (DIM6/NTAB) family NADH-FMN oxidoreductase RutF